MIIAGTGHRPNKLGGYGDDVQEKLLELALHSLDHLKPERVISGMALGWDQALAAAALIRGTYLIAAVPFASQASRWPAASQRTYESLLKKADRVVFVDEENGCRDAGEYSVLKMHQRNEWMVRSCDRLLALWNGDETGGTANCIQFARSLNVPITNAWQAWTERFAPA
jgi:uncharacterized phage-like protein YoqJ